MTYPDIHNPNLGKGRCFDKTFSNESVVVIILNTNKTYKDADGTLQYFIFSNDNYDRKGSNPINPPHQRPDAPIETIELSLKDGQILQCYGSHNKETQYHNEIISLVNQNSHFILAA